MNKRIRRPDRRASVIFGFEFENHRYRATISRFDDGRIAELFLDAGKVGTGLQHHASTSAILTSKLLQLGVPVEEISRSVGGVVGAALAYFANTPAVL
jgi:ribonucleoside-diphosphate reductase alpha chain